MDKKNQFITDLISRMTLDQKIGAVLTLGFSGTIPRQHIIDEITKYHCGGLRLTPGSREFGSYIDPKSGAVVVEILNNNGYKKGIRPPATTSQQYKETLDRLQAIALDRPGSIPLHYSLDQEGEVNANYSYDGVQLFPMPMGIRATNDPTLAYEAALATARQCRSVGYTWVHSPVLDINVNPRNPEICTRAYSDRVEDVITYAEQTCRGFRDGGLIATAKHFPGRGDSDVDAHFDVPVVNISYDLLLKRDLLPYKILIEKDLIPSVMLAHGIYSAVDPDDISTVSKKVVTGLLRDTLGYDGVITTDSMTMGALAKRYGVARACAMSLVAGSDLVLMKAENKLVEETFSTIKSFITEKKMSEEELDNKVYRVLRAKYNIGLFTGGTAAKEDPDQVKKDPHILEISKRVARRSVLVMRDTQKLLPLDATKKVLVIEQLTGAAINDMNWHPGQLFEYCSSYNNQAHYLEVAYNADDDDRQRIAAIAPEFDTIIVTNYYGRNNVGNIDIVRDLAAQKGKKVILVTNTPYPLSVAQEAQTVVITFAVTPENLRTTAGVLFGKIVPEGVWPVNYQP